MGNLAVADWDTRDRPFRLDDKQPLLLLRGHDVTHDHLWDYAGSHLGFHGWLRVVNRRIERVTGIGLLDLPDRLWRDDYDSRMPPVEAADVAIDQAAAEFAVDLA